MDLLSTLVTMACALVMSSWHFLVSASHATSGHTATQIQTARMHTQYQSAGCRAAARLQKLPLRPKAKPNELLGLLPCWPLVAGTFLGLTGSRGAGGGENAFLVRGPNKKCLPLERARRARGLA